MRFSIRTLLAVLSVAFIVAAPHAVLGQAQEPAPQPAPFPEPGFGEPQQPSVQGQVLEGELSGVDMNEMVIILIGEDSREMLFHFDDQTEVAGELDSIQGLTGRSGAWVRIEYRAEGTRAVAERIEVLNRDQANPDRPAAPDQPQP